MQGWIKLHRSIKKHWLYSSSEPFTKLEAWIDILLEVNHSPQKVCIDNVIINCKCGDSLNSLDTWAKRWNWNKSKVRRFIKLLESDSMCVTKSTRKTTHLTVCNYEKYQVERNTDETQMKHKRNTSETQAALNKNEKNENNSSLSVSKMKKDERDSLISNFIKDKELVITLGEINTHYDALDWLPGGKEIKDIKSVLLTWHRNKLKEVVASTVNPDNYDDLPF